MTQRWLMPKYLPSILCLLNIIDDENNLITGSTDWVKPVESYSGIWREWFEDGEIKLLCNFENGKLEGRQVAYDDGYEWCVAICKNGLLDGSYTISLYGTTKILSQEYKAGIKNGKSLEWYETGERNVIGQYFNDDEDGLWEYYFKNGELSGLVNYKNGKSDGEEKQWSDKGHLTRLNNYIDGMRVGRQATWTDEGIIKFEEIYEDRINTPNYALLQRSWFHDNGVKWTEHNLVNGKMVSFMEWNNEGVLIVKEYFKGGIFFKRELFKNKVLIKTETKDPTLNELAGEF